MRQPDRLPRRRCTPPLSNGATTQASRPPRAVQRFTESPNRSKCLFLRDSGRKTAPHFSWNCSSPSGCARRIC
ncbi:MAG: hypothetical protein EOQ50_04390 [Mesorhizobium sp.]|nr:MAG: hypothetical protein EOQ50_04390 [Mesorhizobium sp.]